MTQDNNIHEDDDAGLLRAWRDEAREMPGELLDRRILKAAEIHRLRRRVLPLAAAMAACLVLALYAVRPQPSPAPLAVLDTSTIGLYEGRSTPVLADPAAAQQLMLYQAPRVSSTPTAFSP